MHASDRKGYEAPRIAGLALIGLCVAGAAHAEVRAFTRADYETYFEPGRFATHSPFYKSDGLLEIVSRGGGARAGAYILRQTTRSLDVSSNYDTLSGYPFYKIKAQTTEHLAWDGRRNLYVFEYSHEEFDANESEVWESYDPRAEISANDRSGGLLHAFYKDADARAGHDVDSLHDNYRQDVVGVWTWSCGWIVHEDWDVECVAVHVANERTETYFYRKLDLIG